MSNNNIVAKPYAEALVTIANTTNQLSSITKDVLGVFELLSNSPSLKSFLMNPAISKDSKKTVLTQLLDNQVNSLIITFLCFLIDKHRITIFNNIVKYYLDLSNKLDKTTVVYLRTAQMLTPEQYQMLENKICNMTNCQTIKIKTQIDSKLIAGLIIQIGSKIIDTSLLGQLQKMSSYLNSNRILI